eukprot:89638-Pleurochrysis_carterae.AAC.1
MTPIDVLGALMVLRVVGEVDGTLPDFSEESTEVCTASFAASDVATISASQEESATLACFLDDQEMAVLPYVNTHPVLECRTAQSESEWPRTLCGHSSYWRPKC